MLIFSLPVVETHRIAMTLIQSIINSKYSDAEFFKNQWGRTFLHVPGAADRFSALLNFASFTEILNNHLHLSWPDVRIVPNSEDETEQLEQDDYTQVVPYFVEPGGEVLYKRLLDPQKIADLKARGASIILADAQNLSASIRQFHRELVDYFREQVNIVIYYSQKEKNTYGPHFDGEEVLVFQLEGEKKWYFYGYSEEYPLLNQKAYNTDFKPQVQQTVLLKQGDFMYVPRGLWHSAEAVSNESLSFGISVTCRTNYHLCRKILEELLLPNLTMDPFLRQNLSMHLTTNDDLTYKTKDVDQLLPQLKKQLITHIQQLDIEEIYPLVNALNGKAHQLSSMNDSLSYPIQFGERKHKQLKISVNQQQVDEVF